MYQPPNPVEALRQATQGFAHRLGAIETTPTTSAPHGHQATGGDGAWDGRHCVWCYSYDTVCDWPAVPTFNKGNQ